MNSLKKILSILLLVFGLYSCQKQNDSNELVSNAEANNDVPKGFFIDAIVPGVATGANNLNNNAIPASNSEGVGEGSDPNNGDDPVVLGGQLPNPYTVPNMQQAYNILYGTGTTLSANYKYVRHKPSNAEQLEALEADDELELQDYPMDYEVIQEGDYYQDPNIGTEDIPWLYSVVAMDYVAPQGIQFEVLSTLYIPNDNLTL